MSLGAVSTNEPSAGLARRVLPTAVLVVRAREDLEIARQARALLGSTGAE